VNDNREGRVTVDATIVSAMAAVLGSLVGGSATVATAWVTQKTLGRREFIGTEIHRRETLYGDFIRECSRQVIASYEGTLDKTETVVPIYELINRIRLSASDVVLAEAERALQRIVEQYFEPNVSMEEMRALSRSSSGDPLKAFADACRAELKSMHGAL
jgi:hypothetical protein